jgi:hypothetical protein
MAGVGRHTLGLSMCGGEVHHEDPLHHERGFMSWLFVCRGYCDSLLANELALPLHCLALSVGLQSMGSCSLRLPESVSSLER